MASNSTSLATSGGYANGFTLSISWSENSTSTNNNTSNITATATLSKNQATFWVTGAGILRCYWHDNHENKDKLISEGWIEEIGYQQNSRSVGGTFNATHNDDGTLSGYAWAQWENRSTYGGYPPASGSVATGWVALTKIPRKATITAASNFNDEQNPSFTFKNDANAAMSCWLEPNPDGEHYAERSDLSGTSGTYTWNLTEEERNQLRAACTGNSCTIRIGLYSTIGSTTYSDFQDKTFTIINGNPQFSDFTFTDINNTTTAITGNDQVMISGKSTLQTTISAANKAVAKKQATMTKYTYQVAGLTAEDAYTTNDITRTLGSPTVATTELPNGIRDLVVAAIDSRGNQTAVTKQVTIVPYEAPKVNASATRASGFEATTTIKIAGTFSRIEVGGTAKNTVNSSTGVSYRYKEQNTTTWGAWINRAATIDASTGKVTVADFQISLDNQKAYDFQFRITDKLETTTASVTVSIGQPAFWIGDDGRVAVGGMPTASKASGEAGLLQVMGKVIASNIYPVGSIYMTTTMTSASQVDAALGGTWVAWGGGRVPVGMGSNGTTNYTTVEATGGEEKHKLTVAEMPSHRHYTSNFNGGGNNQGVSTTNAQPHGDHNYWNFNNPGNSSATGGNGAHENRQPYITVYMYKRTA